MGPLFRNIRKLGNIDKLRCLYSEAYLPSKIIKF